MRDHGTPDNLDRYELLHLFGEITGDLSDILSDAFELAERCADAYEALAVDTAIPDTFPESWLPEV